MFKFNFSNAENITDYEHAIDKDSSNAVPNGNVSFGTLDIDEISIPDLDIILNDGENFKKFYLNESEYIEYFQLNDYNERLLTELNESLNEINKTSDLVKGVYEGGLKAWECSFDLARYLYSNIDSILPSKSEKANIVELGCGHALPVLALLKTHVKDNIDTIYLQDFNIECLQIQTFINIKKNVPDISRLKIKFVYGSWNQVLANNILPSNIFNLILSSETIYNRSYYKDLLDIFKHLLNDDQNSSALLAAKTYYFGCGGNLFEFLELAKSKTYSFSCSKNLLDMDPTKSDTKSDISCKGKNLPTISREIIKMQ
jgi:hypothetical protein